MTPLHAAAKGGRVESVRYVCNSGATVDIKDDDGVSILHFTADGIADLEFSCTTESVPSFLRTHSQSI